MVHSKKYIIITMIALLASMCSIVDSQSPSIIEKSVYEKSVQGEYIKIPLEQLYDGESFKITATPIPDIWENIFKCYWKIYKYSEELKQLDPVRSDGDFCYVDSFQINDISQPGSYYLLLSTESDATLCIGRGIVDICSTLPGYTLDWNVMVEKLIDINTSINWNEKGELHLNRQEYDEALADFKYALEINPQYAEAYINKGLALASEGILDSAILSYEEAIQKDPNIPEAWYNYGCALSKQGRYREAVNSLEKSISLRPQYSDLYKEEIGEIFYIYGSSLAEQGMITEACEVFDRVMLINPSIGEERKISISEILYKKGIILSGRNDYCNATAVMNNAIAINPKIKESYGTNIAQVWLKCADNLFVEKRYKDACEATKRAFELNYTPSEIQKKVISEYYLSLGQDLLNQGRFEEARKEFDSAFDIFPNQDKKNRTAEICLIRGRNLNQIGQYQNATIAYNMAIAIQPELCNATKDEMSHAWFNLGRSFREKQRCRECIEAFNKALEYNPSDNSAISERDICQDRISAGLCN